MTTGARPSRFATATAALACLALAACGDLSVEAPPTITTPLRTLAAQRGIAIGAATGSTFQRSDALGDKLRAILAREFDMVWSGNFLKFSTLRPTATSYDFSWADSMVAFAQTHSMTVRGHTFVWHNQIPAWLTGGTWTPAQVDSILAGHIATVMAHFKGRSGSGTW